MLNDLGCHLHHIGIACRKLDTEQACWSVLGYVLESPEFEDPCRKCADAF